MGMTQVMVSESPTALRARIAALYAELGASPAMIEAELPSEADLAGLQEMVAAPKRILDVGAGVGARSLLLALAFPGARVIGVDPDLPLESSGGARPWRIEGEATTLALARAAAERLRIGDRLKFVAGGFADGVTTRSGLSEGRPRVRVIGPQISAEERPLDLVFVGGLSSSEARAADIRLAASALAPDGLIACSGVVGAAGATVRAGVFEFLRYYPDYHLLHGAHSSERASLGFLRHRAAGWFKGFAPPAPPAGMSSDIREKIADLAALTFGDRPILEVAIGAPVLGADFRSRGLASRTLRLTATDWTTHFFDPVIDQISNALNQTPDSVLFSCDLLDYAPDEFVGRLFARLADRRTQALILATPPGEAGLAGSHSRPAARIVDLAASQGLSVYSPVRLEFERARHGARDAATSFGSTSRHANLFLFGPEGGARDSRGRSLLELPQFTASVHEQVELQRIWEDASLRRNLDAEALKRERAEGDNQRFRTDLDAARAEVTALREHNDAVVSSLQSEVNRLRQELNAAKDAEGALRGDLTRMTQEFGSRTKENETEAGALRREATVLKSEVARLTQANSLLETKKTEAEAAARDAIARRQELERDLNRRLDDTLRGVADARDGFQRGITGLTQRFESVTQLEAQFADGWRNEKAMNLREIESLRQAEGALRARLQELQTALAERQAELGRVTAARDLAAKQLEEQRADFRSAASAHAREKEGLETRLSKESLELVAANIREADARARLTGIASHVDLARRMITDFQRSPAAFDPDQIPYIERPLDVRVDQDLPEAVRRLHGESADLSQEIARTLGDMSQRNASFDTWRTNHMTVSAVSHEKALESTRLGFADIGETDRMMLDAAALRLRRQEELLERLETLLFGDAEHPERKVRPPFDLPSSLDAASPARRLLLHMRAHEDRLAHLALAVETDIAMADIEDMDDLDDDPDGGSGATLPTLTTAVAEPVAPATPVVAPAPEPTAHPPGPAPAAIVAAAAAPVVAVVKAPTPVLGPVRTGPSAGAVAAKPTPVPSTQLGAAATSLGTRPAVTGPGVQQAGWGERFWNWLRTYDETSRLKDIQLRMGAQFGPKGVLPRVFDPDHYMAQGPITGFKDPMKHYLLVGEKKGRSPVAGFDPVYYGNALGARRPASGSLLRHFFTMGVEMGVAPGPDLANMADAAKDMQMSPLEYYFRWAESARRKARSASSGAVGGP
jgi:SAM-dependent methyltransferase